MALTTLEKALRATHVGQRFINEKSNTHLNGSEVSLPYTSYHERQSSTLTSRSRMNPKRECLLRQYRKVRRWGKIASAISEVISAILSIFIESIMIYVIYKFYTTRHLAVQGRPWGPWALGSIIWPTLMFAAASIVSSILALVALIALWYRSKRRAAWFSLVFAAVHVIAWIIVSVVYRVEKQEKDLWGWSCTTKAKAIQQQLGSGKLDFGGLCKLQVSYASEKIS